MQPIQNLKVPDTLLVRVDEQKVVLPAELRGRVDAYWADRVTKNPKLRNGEVFTVTSMDVSESAFSAVIRETDYAHYLYSYAHDDLGDYTVRILHAAALVVSSENYFIFGSMADHTSIPGVIQCCGGGIDHADIVSDEVDIEHSISKELVEELGIDAYNNNLVEKFYPAYLKIGGPTGKMTITYILRTVKSADEFAHGYQSFVESLVAGGEAPEFSELFYVPNNQHAVETFIGHHHERLNEYMPALLRSAVHDIQLGS